MISVEMARRYLLLLAAVLGSLDAAAAEAETRGTLRAGVMVLELESSPDTPLFGDKVERAVDLYNAAAAARDRMLGGTTARIDAGDLGVAETLFMVTPGLELGGEHYFFRLEAPIGLASALRSIGVGVYPLNLQWKLRRDVTPYASAGVVASWLDRPGAGDVGGLFAARAAAGARLASRFVVELGYSAFALGGNVNKERLESMSITAAEMEHPDKVVAAGEAHGLVDVSLGITF